MKYDYVIVGAGYAGCVLAERLASQCDNRILLIDQRNHIGGNAYDFINEIGIRVHQYGPHVFHTNNESVFQYLSLFTAWIPYEHRVLASVNGMTVPIPVNRTTINQLFGTSFQRDEEVAQFYEKERVIRETVANSEDFVLSKVGKRLYELLYKGYTTKQWGMDPSLLAPSVCARIPIRTNIDDRYFEDRFQAMPANGYTEMFKAMVKHPNISVSLNTKFHDLENGIYNKLIYTGPIDEYFGYLFGKLPYRSLRFEFENHDMEYYQSTAQVNYPNDHAFTRITEFKHFPIQKNARTTIAKEFSSAEGPPYYPIPNETNALIYDRYAKESGKLSTVTFVGRLASYRYYNMDQVVAQALKVFTELADRR